MKQRRNILLMLPSVLYGWGVALRNFAFDNGWIKSLKPSIPTICVGNLSVGGTGKTPHIELLLKLLTPKYRVAVLSRGYGRQTSSPIDARADCTAEEIGDEPLQIIRKYPNLLMLIDSDRCRAVKRIEKIALEFRPQVILMDDGFQHRRIKPAYSILLTPYAHPFTRDRLLPYGNLREPATGKYRADTVIVTGTPKGLRPIDFRLLEGELDLHAHQDLFFSRVSYSVPQPLFAEATPLVRLQKNSPLCLLAGIANPEAFFRQAEEGFSNIVRKEAYPDHYPFRTTDIQRLCRLLQEDQDMFLLCTEKDGARLLSFQEQIPPDVQARILVQPIEIDLSPETKKQLITRLEKAIRNNGLRMI